MMDNVDRRVIEGRETPEDDIYILCPDGSIAWTDNEDDAKKVEEEIKQHHIAE